MWDDWTDFDFDEIENEIFSATLVCCVLRCVLIHSIRVVNARLRVYMFKYRVKEEWATKNMQTNFKNIKFIANHTHIWKYPWMYQKQEKKTININDT